MNHSDRLARVRAEERRALARARLALGLDEPVGGVEALGRACAATEHETAAARHRCVRMHALHVPTRAQA